MKMQRQSWQKPLKEKVIQRRKSISRTNAGSSPGEAVKRDGNETRKPIGEEPPSKKQKGLFAGEKTFEQMKASPSNYSYIIFIEVTISAFETKGSI